MTVSTLCVIFLAAAAVSASPAPSSKDAVMAELADVEDLLLERVPKESKQHVHGSTAIFTSFLQKFKFNPFQTSQESDCDCDAILAEKGMTPASIEDNIQQYDGEVSAAEKSIAALERDYHNIENLIIHLTPQDAPAALLPSEEFQIDMAWRKTSQDVWMAPKITVTEDQTLLHGNTVERVIVPNKFKSQEINPKTGINFASAGISKGLLDSYTTPSYDPDKVPKLLWGPTRKMAADEGYDCSVPPVELESEIEGDDSSCSGTADDCPGPCKAPGVGEPHYKYEPYAEKLPAPPAAKMLAIDPVEGGVKASWGSLKILKRFVNDLPSQADLMGGSKERVPAESGPAYEARKALAVVLRDTLVAHQLKKDIEAVFKPKAMEAKKKAKELWADALEVQGVYGACKERCEN